MVTAALRDPDVTRQALRAILAVESDPAVEPPKRLPALVAVALPQLSESELFHILDALAFMLMTEVRRHAAPRRAAPRRTHPAYALIRAHNPTGSHPDRARR